MIGLPMFSMTKPDDWHTHLRDDARTPLAVAHTAGSFGRAMAMPNLVPPVTTVAGALAYRERIVAMVPAGSAFVPYFTLYLTETTPVAELAAAAENPHIIAVKLYPAGATTNSAAGVRDWQHIKPQLAELERSGLPLCVHGEVIDQSVDIFDRERVFYAETAPAIKAAFPGLRLVCEHITTADAAQFVQDADETVACTITPQHLLWNRNQLLSGGLRPHWYCLPVLKRERDRLALLQLATSGHPRTFAGTDSAPHAQDQKESPCGCAGCYTAPHAVELYATAFHGFADLDTPATQAVFEQFMSHNGATWYGLEPNKEHVLLNHEQTPVPQQYEMDGGTLVPLGAGSTLDWCVKEVL